MSQKMQKMALMVSLMEAESPRTRNAFTNGLKLFLLEKELIDSNTAQLIDLLVLKKCMHVFRLLILCMSRVCKPWQTFYQLYSRGTIQ